MLGALSEFFEKTPVRKLFRTDNRGEYTGKKVTKYFGNVNITHFVTQIEDIKANYADHVLKTMKGRMRYLTCAQTLFQA